MTKRNEVYAAIDSEREYQDDIWGHSLSGDRESTELQPGGTRTVDEFSLYIIGYANDLLVNGSHFANEQDKLAIIRKIAGLGVACMEQHGAPIRSQGRPARK